MELNESYAEYQKNLEDAKKKKDWSKLKLLPAKEIVDKIVKGDKDFSNVRIFGVDWARRDLSGFNFSGSKIEWCIFSWCKLKDANFFNSFLDFCWIESVDLSKSNFRNSIIYNSTFLGATLADADFTNSDFRRVLLADNIGKSNFTNCTQVQVWHSVEDVLRETNIENIYSYIGKSGIPLQESLTIRVKINEFKSAGEKLRLIYDVGRRSFNPEGDLNVYSFKRVGKPSLGEYRPENGTYTSKREYGTGKDEKRTNVYSQR